MYYNNKIPFEQDKIELVIKSFEDGEYLYIENYREHPTVTQNGKGAAIWNNIYTQLASNFKIPGYQTGKISRGFWDLLYLYDEETKYLYTFMREDNFKNLQSGRKRDKLFHYSNVLSRLNGELVGTYEIPYEQLSFLAEINVDEETDTKLEALLKDMTSSINGDIERYALVLVECKRGEVKGIECVIPIAYTNPMYREDWSEYIKAEYEMLEYDVQETCPDDEAIILYTNNEDIDLSVKTEEEKQAK